MFLLRISFQKRRGIGRVGLSLGHHIGVQRTSGGGRRCDRRAKKQMPGIYWPGIANSFVNSTKKQTGPKKNKAS
jgi:hypothetical protein